MCVGPEDEVGHHRRSVQAFGEDTGENGLETKVHLIVFGVLSTRHMIPVTKPTAQEQRPEIKPLFAAGRPQESY